MVELQKQNYLYNTNKYLEVKRKLIQNLPENIKIDHVGSTAIPNMYGKNIIDILIGVEESQFEITSKILEEMNYYPSPKKDKYQFFASTKRETKSGDIHIHLIVKTEEKYREFLILKDYLLRNKEEAKKYSDFKRKLINQGIKDRKKYKNIKSKYVSNLLKKSKEKMNLDEFDNKIVKVKTKYGEIFEGICQYNGKEYTYHEFGRNEESIQFPYMLIYKNDIEEIKILENKGGPYGKFTDKYGLLEKIAADDGIDAIEEVLYSEEKDHTSRLLSYLKDNPPSYDGLKELLEKHLKYEKDKKIIDKIDEVIKILERNDIMDEKKCECTEKCTCGCQEGKECTCDGECNCDEDCSCKKKEK